jgi:autotransporter-associated beta strand protein
MKLRQFVFPITLLGLASGLASAQSVWTGGAANWSSDINPGWNGTGVPNVIDRTADATAAGGTITVNGNYTLGTLTQLGTAGRSLNTATGGTLIFDVTSGNALWDMSSGLTGTGISGGASHSTNVTLNDNTEIRGLVSNSSSSPVFSGIISGTGGLLLTNVATTPTGGGQRVTLNNASNSFQGGTNVGLGVSLRINASGAAGTGAITLTNSPGSASNGIDFRRDTGNSTQVHANDINLGTRGSNGPEFLTFQGGSPSMNVTLNGVISGTVVGQRSVGLNGGTLVLGGANANTWTGQIRADTHGTIIADKVSALNDGFDMRSQVVDSSTTFLAGVADTIAGNFTLSGNNSGAAFAYRGILGLKDGNNGLVTLNGAISINNALGIGGGTAALPTPTISLNLHSGNGTGTLAVGGLISDQNLANARSISISGTGTVNLTRAAGNSYNGTTTVSGGTLLANNTTGSATGTGAMNVSTGAAVGGAGIISGAVTINGSLRPGNSIGTLTVANDATWNAGNAWVFELGLSAASLTLADTTGTRDLLNLTGAVNDFLKGTGSGWTFDFANSGAAGWYKIVDWASTTTFVGSDFTATNLAGGLTGTFTVDATTSALYVNVIPEPTSALLGGLGMLALLRRRRSA